MVIWFVQMAPSLGMRLALYHDGQSWSKRMDLLSLGRVLEDIKVVVHVMIVHIVLVVASSDGSSKGA